ncbi:putative membrane protein [Helicobacter pylori SouthAfrica50]|uniref:Putative membrane protein n=1 Tax=Helicobacter pylori SouthAfrica50 TaxID=1352357 RepID=T2S9G1_HELPX|nr:putative membrane protein [Helicobacter pylori SouthAfrica50]
MCQIQCLLILFAINIISAIVVYFLKEFHGVLNFEGGFLGFFIVALSSYYGVKKRLDLRKQDSEKEEKQKFQKFALGLEMSFNVWRLGGYGVLLGILGALLALNLFNGLFFLIGVFISSLSSALLRFLKNR